MDARPFPQLQPLHLRRQQEVAPRCRAAEARYWLCAPFGGHFVGAHLLYMHYNAGNVHMPFGLWKQLRDYRFQGNLYGGGLVYGYHHIINKRWSIEGAIGLGFAHTCSKYYRCRHCGRYQGIQKKNIFHAYQALAFGGLRNRLTP